MFQLFTLKLPSAPKSAIAADTKNRNNVNMLDRRFNIAPHDGLEREFKFFNRLEGSVCTMCAPGDQKKSSDNQCKQAELNALRCQWRTDVSRGK
jgi:hypothetical protein